jgi:MtrB/PioB family decaheme-associated outer membrane protein
MTHKRSKIVVAAILHSLFLLAAGFAWAQWEVGNYSLTGEAEVGGLPRSFSGQKAKFEEYRDVPESIVVPELKLRMDSKKNDYYLNFDAINVGRNDQNYRLRVGRYGLLDVEFEWDQIPHIFNKDTAATPYRSRDGTFTLSSKPTNSGDCPSDGTVSGWVNGCSHGIDLGLLHGFAKVKLRYTPTPGWTFDARYTSQNVTGDRAFGTAINGFTNLVELAEPIDYQIHNVELGGEYAGQNWTLGLKYNGSLFHNNTSTLLWDNPFAPGLGSGCADAAGLTCRGRLDLYPSNQAHTLTLTGTANLPFKTNLFSTFSYGRRLQDDKFLPFTTNSAIGPLTPGAALPSSRAALLRQSLDGDVRPTLINFTAVNRYFNHLDLKAYYRYYDLDNRSKRLFLPDGYVRTDTGGPSAANEDLKSFPYAYSKQNMGMDAGYQFTRWLNGKFSYGFERMHRERREVLNSDEHSFGPTVDIKPNSWLLFRAGYKRYLRDAHDYDAGRAVVYQTGETPEDIRLDRLEALRKVDEAARKRNKFNFFTQVSPTEHLTLHGSFDLITDDYPRSDIGTQEDTNYSPSVGFVFAPLAWASFFGDYNWERFDWRMRAMQRNNVAQTPESDPDRVWTSRGKDRIHTFSLGTDLKLIENLLGLRLQYGFSYGESLVHASGSTCSGCTPATDYPSVTNRWHELLARFTYVLHKNVELKFGYYFNRYSSKDFGVDIMRLFMGNVDSGAGTSIYLGDRLKGSYEAHVGYLGVRFKF